MHIRDLQKLAYENSKAHGFHDEPINVPEKLALIHEEVSEALGEYRSDRMRLWFAEGSSGSSKPEGFGVELADAVIRIADLAEALEIDLETLIQLKHRYNVNRPHKHGKVC